jgi:hypothetical protein
MNGLTNTEPEAITGAPASIFHRGWPRRIALFGYFVPAVVGVCVRTYLQHIGKPVMEWSWVFDRSVQFLVLLAYWDIPFLLVAKLARRKPLSNRANLLMVLGAFLGTLVASVYLFADMWKNVEAILLGALLIPFLILPGTVVGFVLGWLAGTCFPHIDRHSKK